MENIFKKYWYGTKLAYRPTEPLDIGNFTEDQAALRFTTDVNWIIAISIFAVAIFIHL